MSDKQLEQVMEQFPAGARIDRTYNAIENGELRLVVKFAGEDEDREHRYVVHFEGETLCVTPQL